MGITCLESVQHENYYPVRVQKEKDTESQQRLKREAIHFVICVFRG